MYNYSIIPEYLGQTVTIYNNGNCRGCNTRRYTGFNSTILLTNKTPQEQLERLYALNHPSVTRIKRIVKQVPKLKTNEDINGIGSILDSIK